MIKKLNFIKKNNIVFLIKIVLIIIIILIDYYDIGLANGFGLFSKTTKSNLIEAITGIALIITLFVTWKSHKETLRQTEITLRPYIRFSWEVLQIGSNRREQGITDTCILVTNNGHGLMRQVHYSIKVDGIKVEVRNHSIINSEGTTTLVYDEINNKAGPALGCRNDSDFDKDNNLIIKNKIIEINGTYRDVEGGKYVFNFISDANEQSWFKEKYRQKLINRN